jgi:hypothetical protein
MAGTSISGSTDNTTPELTDEFATNKAGADYRTSIAAILQVVRAGTAFIRQAVSRTLTSTTAEQKLFDSVANGTITLATGTYLFDALFSLSSMSATSGNAAFDILGAGTAVLSDVLYHAVGADGAANTAATQTGSTSTAAQSPNSITTAGTASALQVNLKGTFEVTTGGTIIPSITLVTAAAAVLAAGSYFSCSRIGPVNMVSQGAVT